MTIMDMKYNNNGGGVGAGGVLGLGHDDDRFGDTRLRKVFVGGLAWETRKETLREEFEKYGEILEAVVISDKLSARSKGYGFVTFKEAEAAKKACEEPSVMINGRLANCNLASLGAVRKLRPTTTKTNYSDSSSNSPPLPSTPLPLLPHPHTQGQGGGSISRNNQVLQYYWWYYPSHSHSHSPFHFHHPHALPAPFYVNGAAHVSGHQQQGAVYRSPPQYFSYAETIYHYGCPCTCLCLCTASFQLKHTPAHTLFFPIHSYSYSYSYRSSWHGG